MNTVLFLVFVTDLFVTIARATLQRDVITNINVFRHLHAAGPVLVDDVIQKAAQNAATTFMKTKTKDQVPIFQYSANFCKYTGSEATLDRVCVISWYVSMKYFSWCHPKAEGQALPFVNMIWKASSKAGVGIAKDTDGTYYVVVYIALQDANNVAGNVPPVKVVMEASQKAQCPTGYSRFETSCFKYDTAAVSWDEAVVRCARENATLASIRNAKEETFVRDLQRKAGSTAETWIGLHDTLYEGQFKWFDGLRFKHGVCVPVHANGGHLENCVAWSIARPEGCWEDRRCNEKIPYTCRIPVEGKSTYRTEILFKKFRWRPNYKDKNSKAYRDLINGIKITFKEIFTRKSGKKKGGFKKVTVKGVRAISFKGRPAGLGIALSIKFRSFNADPTLRFQKFLRGSEKLLSMNIDKPDKVEGKTGKAGDYCYNACNQKQTCTASHQQQSTYGYYPGFPAPAPQPYPPGVYSASYPGSVQSVATTTSDPYPSTCPMSCSQRSTLNCYMQCRDECCDNRNGKRKRKRKPNRISALKHMKENFGKLDQLIEEVRKQPKDRSGDSISETNGTEEKAEKVIESMETNAKQLGVGFKTKNKVRDQSHLHNMHEATDNRKEHFTINLNETQNSKPSTFDEEHNNGYNLEKVNSHDMIDDISDDDREIIHSNESSIELQDNPGKNKVISESNQKENGKEIQIHGNELGDERESDSLVNEEDAIPQNQEISMHEEDEEGMKDNSDDENSEPGESHSEPDDDDDDDDDDDNDDDDSETNIEDDDSDQSRDDFAFRDSLKDPGDDMLDEEGIGDVGKFGKKRDKVLKGKKSFSVKS